jgi:glycerophosphoryl diester phosphodiesterase
VSVRRIGHKGADHIVPGNTLASFDAAVQAGVDMIEFDVLPHEGRLVLAHDYDHDLAGAVTLDEGLEHLAGLDIDLDVDLKWHGYEEQVVEALRRHGLLERSLVSSMFMRSLVTVRELEPRLRLGWSVPRTRRDYTRSWLTKVPAAGALVYFRRRIVGAAVRHLREGRIDALMAHYLVVTPALVREVLARGGEIYVWTVDDVARIRALERLGVTGVISNDPRLFAYEMSQVAAE